MSYEAKVFRILIASPTDVEEEREIAVKTIQEWNDLNSAERQIVLLPLRWETHTAPEYGKRPQEIINKQIVDQCDLLIGIFWTISFPFWSLATFPSSSQNLISISPIPSSACRWRSDATYESGLNIKKPFKTI